jgi:hypothetical protein
VSFSSFGILAKVEIEDYGKARDPEEGQADDPPAFAGDGEKSIQRTGRA